MNDFLKKAIFKEEITDEDLANELYDVCDRVHSSCNNDCPIYDMHWKVPVKEWDWNCEYFKSGTKMLRAIREAKEYFTQSRY